MGQNHSDICNLLSFRSSPPQVRSAPTIEKANTRITEGTKTRMSGLLTTTTLSLAAADEIATLAIKACQSNEFKPISICVMDPFGHEIVTKRMDGCPVSLCLF